MRAIKLSLTALWLTAIASTSASISTIDPGRWTGRWYHNPTGDGDLQALGLAPDGSIIGADIEGWYQNGGHAEMWRIDPETKANVSIAGNPTVRGGVDGNGTDATIFGIFQYVTHPTEADTLVFTDTSKVRKVNVLTGQITTLVGAPSGSNSQGYTEGFGTAARFSIVYGIARHELTGYWYMTEHHGRRIRRAIPDDNGEPYDVWTQAGDRSTAIPSAANTNGHGGGARFHDPRTISIKQSTGDMWIPDYSGNRMRHSTHYGEVTTPNTVSQMPGCDMTADERYLYCTQWDTINRIIRFDLAISWSAYDIVVNVQSIGTYTSNERTPLGNTKWPHMPVITPLNDKLYVAERTYGDGMSIGLLEFDPPYAAPAVRPAPGPAVDVGNFTNPWLHNDNDRVSHTVGVLDDGRVMYLDRGMDGNQRTQFRVVDPVTMVDTYVAGQSNSRNGVDGVGSSATLHIPLQMVQHPTEVDGMIFGDYSKVRKINVATQRVTTLVGAPSGSHAVGRTDGTGTSARFYYASGLARYEATGDWFIAELYGRRVRRATSNGAGEPRVVYKFAGRTDQDKPSPASVDGIGSHARFYDPRTIALKQSNGEMFVTDYVSNQLRHVTQRAAVTTANSWVPQILHCSITANERYLFCTQWEQTNGIVRFDLSVGTHTYDVVVNAAQAHSPGSNFLESNEDTSQGKIVSPYVMAITRNSDRLYIAQHRRRQGPTIAMLELDIAQTIAPTPAPPSEAATPPPTLPEGLYTEDCGQLSPRAQQRAFSDRRLEGN